DLRGDEEFTRLFFHRTEGQNNFAVQLIEDLGESGINRGKATEDYFVTGEMFEAGTCTGKIADGQHEKKNRQCAEDDLQWQIEQHRGHAQARKPERCGSSCRVHELGNRFVHGACVRRESAMTQSRYRLESRAGDASKAGRRIATWLQQRAC